MIETFIQWKRLKFITNVVKHITAISKSKERVKMKIYNKLIRDRIPEIIEESGRTCSIHTLNDEEYLQELNKKLSEELKEYQESGELEELADLVEIVYAIAEFKGSSIEEFERIRQDKSDRRGGFEKRLFLESVEGSLEKNMLITNG
jgi:predicted house-cleaning noncanonical NTP pyrophosphatase (MazG superfamily)